MDINNQRFASIEQIAGQYLPKKTVNHTVQSDVSFDSILRDKVSETKKGGELKFSKHASKRLTDRNITLSNDQISRLEKGATLSGQKGIKDTLVLMDEYAFIVNTDSNTVVTAMQKDIDGENIYTNIDGAVLV